MSGSVTTVMDTKTIRFAVNFPNTFKRSRHENSIHGPILLPSRWAVKYNGSWYLPTSVSESVRPSAEEVKGRGHEKTIWCGEVLKSFSSWSSHIAKQSPLTVSQSQANSVFLISMLWRYCPCVPIWIDIKQPTWFPLKTKYGYTCLPSPWLLV